eukprot:IDg16687t1
MESDDGEHEDMEVEKAEDGDETMDGTRSCQSPEVSRVTVSPTSSEQIEYSEGKGAHIEDAKEQGATVSNFLTPKKQGSETFPCMPGLRRTDDSRRETMNALMQSTARFVSSQFMSHAATCASRLQTHEDALLLRAKTKRGMAEEREFFSAVRDIVDAVCSLRACYQDLVKLRKDALNAGDSVGPRLALLDGTLARFDCSSCERLVMGAIQHAEASACGTRNLQSTENVRLQAYSYITKRLLYPASPLST